jgi:hypothetical protein
MSENNEGKGVEPINWEMIDRLYGKYYCCMPSDKHVKDMLLKRFGLKDTKKGNHKMRTMMYENTPEFQKVVKDMRWEK